MTFEDWMMTKDCNYYPTDDTMAIRKLRECWDAAQKYGEVAQQLSKLEKQNVMLRDAMENCRLLAARHRKEEWASHILRFCNIAEVTATPLREGEK